MVWPFGIYFALVILIVAGMLAVSYVLGPRHNDRTTATPYESGVLPYGSARVRLSAKFYLIAMFFVIFDIEAVFIFAWAVTARQTGWTGFWAILMFVVVLVATLAYLWRTGALEWGTIPTNTRIARGSFR
jgi:NADH-quinone oxidoreductase subunit A